MKKHCFNRLGDSTGPKGLSLFVLTVALSIATLAMASLFVSNAQAANEQINFQARLLSDSGALVPDGDYHVEFKIYCGGDGAVGGGADPGSCAAATGTAEHLQWTETHTTGNLVQVKNGYVTAKLGSINSTLASAVDWGQDELWLTINIGGTGGSPSWDGEMDPMMRFTSVPYAFDANNLDGRDSSEFVQLDPGATQQDVNTANTAINVNQTGAGDILRLRSAGNEALIVTNNRRIGVNDTTPDAQLDVQISSASNVGLLVQAAASQTADILQVFASNGTTEYLSINSGGAIFFTQLDCSSNANGGVLTADSSGQVICQDDDGGGVTSTTLQNAYDNSTTSNPKIRLTNTFGGFSIADNNILAVGANLFEVQNGAGTVNYFAVDANGIDVVGTATIDGGLVVTAGNALRLVGGNTASRPASPSEGQVYFDTDTDELVYYSNGKWQAARGEYTIVAANDSTQAEKDAADYVADGVDDEDTINTALTAAAGGKVLLLAGTYQVDINSSAAGNSIEIPNNTTLAGVGTGTVIELQDIDVDIKIVTNSDTSTGTGIAVKDLKIDGQFGLNTTGNQYGIYLSGVGLSSGTRQGALIESIVTRDIRGGGIYLNDAENIVITDSQITRSSGIAINVTNGSNGVNIVGNSFQGNGSGVYLQLATNYHNVTGNTFDNTSTTNIYVNAAYSVIDSNVIDNGTVGVGVDNNFNIISNNIISSLSAAGVDINTGDYNIIEGNNIFSVGGSSAFDAIDVNGSHNQITGNRLSDIGCNTTCYGITITGGTNNYVSGNYISDTDPDDDWSINDAGTNTVFAGQTDGSGNFDIQGFSGSLNIGNNTDITGTLGVSALATFSGGLTIQTGDTFTFNGDAFTDLTGNGLAVVSNALTLSLEANKGLAVDGSGLSLIDCALNEVLKYNGSNQWACASDATGSGVTTVGTIDSQTKSADGAVISGTSIYLQTADASNPGLVSTAAQTFAGNKTFSNDVTVSGLTTLNGNVDLGNATSDTITFTGRVDSSILPSADDTYDLGSSTNRWRDLYLGPNSLNIGTDANNGTLSYDTTNSEFDFNRNVSIERNDLSNTNALSILSNSSSLSTGNLLNIEQTSQYGTETTVTGSLINVDRNIDNNLSVQKSVTHDSTTEIDLGSGTVETYSHTVNPNGDRLLIVGVNSYRSSGGQAPTSVTYDGINLTEIASRTNSQGNSSMWYLVNPPVGTADVEITFGALSSWTISHASNYYNVDQASPIGDFDTQSSSGSVSLDITSQSNDMVVDTLFAKDASSVTEGASQTEVHNLRNPTTHMSASSYEPGAAPTVTMSYTRNNTPDATTYVAANLNATSSDGINVQGPVARIQSNCTETTGSCSDSSSVLELGQLFGSATGTVLSILNAGTGDSLNVDSGALVVNGSGNTSLSGTLTVTGLATLNGGLTIQTGDTFTFNSDAFTDLTGNGLAVVSNALTLSLEANKGLAVDGSGLSLIDCALNEVLKYNGSNQWACASDATGSGGVTAVGTIDSQTKSSNGAVISGSSIYLQTADASNPGLLSTAAQTIAGDKTFTGFTSLDGNVDLGDATSDTITFNGYVGSSILPSVNDTYDLGSSTLRWRDLYLGPNSLHIGANGDEGTIGYDTVNDEFDFDQNINSAGTLNVRGVPTGNSSTQGSLIINPLSNSSDPTVQWSNQDSWNAPDPGGTISPTFVDIDNDGDLDMYLGEDAGIALAYENTGNATNPSWTANASWNLPNAGSANIKPVFGDLDGDGDFDALVGVASGVSLAYENTGTISSPSWTANASWDVPDVGSGASPALGDLDGDGDLDLIVGRTFVTSVVGYRNIGGTSSPSWSANAAWDISGLTIGDHVVSLGDLDLDGDLDIIVAYQSGDQGRVYENTGSPSSVTWTRNSSWDTPTTNVIVPALGDLDGDGDLDLMLGEHNGIGHAYENTGSAAGGFDNTLLGISVNGDEKLRVNAAGSTQITANSSSYAGLVVNQIGSGNIIEFQDGGSSVFTLADGGNATLSGDFGAGTNDAYSLGSSTVRWQDLFLGAGGLNIGTGTDSGLLDYLTSTDSFRFNRNINLSGNGPLNLVIDNSSPISTGDSYEAPDTTGDVGEDTAIVLDSNGYPVIAYYDQTNDNLKVMHCNDANCAGSDESIEVVDSTGTVGLEPSIVLDSNGYPVISYFDQTDQTLNVMHCNDVNCAGGNESIETFASTGGDATSSIKLDSNGYPVIAHYNNGLWVIRCNDVNCAGGDDSYIEVVTGSFDGVGLDLELDSNEYPVISYSDFSFNDLELVHCNDVNCAGGDDNPVVVVNEGSYDVSDTSLELDASGNPIIAYRYMNNTGHELKLVNCDDPNCSGSGDTVSIIDSSSGENFGMWTTMVLDGAGNPVIAYHDDTNGDLRIIHCDDPACSGGGEVINVPDSTDDVGRHISMVLDSSGFPVIAYHDETNDDLNVLHCDDAFCNTSAGDTASNSGKLEFKGNFWDSGATTNTSISMSQLLNITNASTYELAFYNSTSKIASLDESGNFDIQGSLVALNGSFTGTLTVTGTASFNGDINLGDANGDSITFNGTVDSDIVPFTDNTYSLGTPTVRWRDLYLGPDSLNIGANGNYGVLSYDTTNSKFVFDKDLEVSGADLIADNLRLGVLASGSQIDAYGSKNALTDLSDRNNYHLNLRSSNTGTNTAVGIALGNTNVGAAIVYEDLGNNSLGQLTFYTKQSGTAGDPPVAGLVLKSDGTLQFNNYNCSLSGGGGALTTDGSGNVICSADDSGAGSIGWVDSGTTVHLTTNSDNVGIGTVTASAKLDIEVEAPGAGDSAKNALEVTGAKGGAGLSLGSGGAGSSITLTAGDGGDIGVGQTSGSGGNISLQSGFKGSGVGGSDGAIVLNSSGGSVLLGTTSTRGKLTINHDNATQVALSLQVRGDQDANTDLAEFLDAGGTKRTWINEKGELRTRAAADNSVAFRVKDNSSSQTGHLLQIAGQSPADTLAFFDGRGRLAIGYAAATNSTNAGAALEVDAVNDGEIAALIRGNSATQTGDLLRIVNNSTGNVQVASVASSGKTFFKTIGNATDAFMIQRGDSNAIFQADTTNQRVVLKSGGSIYTPGDFAGRVMAAYLNNTGAATNAAVSVQSGTSGQASLYFGDTADSDIGQITYDNSDNSLRFTVNTSEAARFDSSGNLGIGATIPGEKLHVQGGDALLAGGPKALQLRTDGSNNHVFMEFYARDAALTTRSGYLGYASNGTNNLTINNELSGDIILNTGGGATVAEVNNGSSTSTLRVRSTNNSATLGAVIEANRFTDYRGAGLLITSQSEAEEWFAGVRYTGGAFQIGYDSSGGQAEHGDNALLKILEGGEMYLQSSGTTNVITFSNDDSTTTVPDIQFNASGLISAEDDLYLNIDSNNGTSNARFAVYRNDDDTTGQEIFFVDESGDTYVGLNGSTIGCVRDENGTILVGTCNSDIRLKKNVNDIGNTLDRFGQLRAVTYNWRNGISVNKENDGTTTEYGFIAQEVEKLFPHLVMTDPAGYKRVDYSTLSILAIDAITELDVKRKASEGKIMNLSNKIQNIINADYLQNGKPATLSSLNVSGKVKISGDLRVKNVVVDQDIKINRHIITAGEKPEVQTGEILSKIDHIETPATSDWSEWIEIDGNDIAGTITIRIPTEAEFNADLPEGEEHKFAAGKLVKLNFAEEYTSESDKPRIILTPLDKDAVKMAAYVDYASVSNGGFTIYATHAPQYEKVYRYNYLIVQ